MNNLKDIHNLIFGALTPPPVVILGFQWTIWRTYTTANGAPRHKLGCYIRISMNNLKDIHNCYILWCCTTCVVILGFQWTIWRTYTTVRYSFRYYVGCYIRISMNNLKDIHNGSPCWGLRGLVVILGFQWTIWRTYTTPTPAADLRASCYIRISMNNLKDIHNCPCQPPYLHGLLY